MRSSSVPVIALFTALASITLPVATTIIPLGFDQVVGRAGIVVQGTVVDTRIVATGPDIHQTKIKPSTSPAVAGAALNPGAVDGVPGTGPRSVGVEGGHLPCTEVTLAVDRVILGNPGPTLTFRVAGGDLGTRKVFIPGLPYFAPGKQYIVFLRPDYQTTNVPVVGVNQGFFELSRETATGRQVLLTADGDIVIGIEENRLLFRRNPERSGPSLHHPGPAPTVRPASRSVVRPNSQAERYEQSLEPSMLLDDFIDAVLAAREGRP